LIGAALIGGVITLGALFLPGMRDIEGIAAEDAQRDAPPLDPDFLRPPAFVDLRR
jgi:hypothetical protein